MKYRVLIITEIIAPYRIPVFNALAKRDGIELHVVFLAETDPALREWCIYKEEIQFSYEVLCSWRKQILGYHVLLNKGLWTSLTKWTPDVVICGGYNYLASWEANLWAKGHYVPFVLWCESNANDKRGNHFLVESLKRIFLKRCKYFVVPGKASFEYLGLLGVPTHIITIAPNAVDIKLFTSKAREARGQAEAVRNGLGLPKRFFLYVGRLLREKGVFDLIEAYEKLEERLRSEIGLVVVGNGPAKPKLLERTASIKTGRIQFHGFVERDNLPKYYGLAEALIFPTLSDPWGLVVNEAMACSLPIIASSVAGCIPDLVVDPWNGYAVAPGDIERMTWAMSNLANQPELAKKMGANSFEHILSYSPEACAHGLGVAIIKAKEC